MIKVIKSLDGSILSALKGIPVQRSYSFRFTTQDTFVLNLSQNIRIFYMILYGIRYGIMSGHIIVREHRSLSSAYSLLLHLLKDIIPVSSSLLGFLDSELIFMHAFGLCSASNRIFLFFSSTPVLWFLVLFFVYLLKKSLPHFLLL